MSNYNGWSNYETWNCSLHIMDVFIGEDSKVSADAVENMVRDLAPDGVEAGSLYNDIIETYISAVDFEEIAAAINEANEIEDEDEDEG
jgi:hypothetical protein